MRLKQVIFLLSWLAMPYSDIFAQCPDGTILFKEDFGGNNVSDPIAQESGIPQCSYNYKDNPKGAGNYAIRKVGWDHNQWYYPLYDHTYPEDGERGYFMQIDGAGDNKVFYQIQIDDLCENTNLYLSMWGMSSTKTMFGESANIRLVIEDMSGNILASKDVLLENQKGYWEQFGLDYVIPEGTSSIIYKIINNSYTSNGNDFAIDDIEIRLCKTPVHVNTPEDPLCKQSEYTLTADYDNSSYIEPINVTWFKNTQKEYNAEGWEKVSTGKSLTFDKLNKEDEGYYKAIVSSAGVEGIYNLCNSASDIIPIFISEQNCCTPNDTTISDTTETGTYSKNGFLINDMKTGLNTYTLELENQSGCDSIVTLKVLYNKKSLNEFADTICDGTTYSFAGMELNKPGEYTDSLESEAGCDSVILLHLTVLAKENTIISDTTETGVYVKNGFDIIDAVPGNNTYSLELTSQNGCDSTVTLLLFRKPAVFSEISDTICEGTDYTFANRTIKESGDYIDSLKSETGRDSVILLHLTVLNKKQVTIFDTTYTESYEKNGFLVTATKHGNNQFTNVFISQRGCDSIVTLELFYPTSAITEIKDTICRGGAYHFADNYYRESGVYTDSLTGANGRDSIVVLHLAVVSRDNTTLSDTTNTGTYTKYNFNITETTPGLHTYTMELINQKGCDSIVTLNLF